MMPKQSNSMPTERLTRCGEVSREMVFFFEASKIADRAAAKIMKAALQELVPANVKARMTQGRVCAVYTNSALSFEGARFLAGPERDGSLTVVVDGSHTHRERAISFALAVAVARSLSAKTGKPVRVKDPIEPVEDLLATCACDEWLWVRRLSVLGCPAE